MNLEFLEIASVALLPRNDGILEFPKIKIPPNPQKTKIPYRDPRVKLGDDIVGNSRFPKLEFPQKI